MSSSCNTGGKRAKQAGKTWLGSTYTTVEKNISHDKEDAFSLMTLRTGGFSEMLSKCDLLQHVWADAGLLKGALGSLPCSRNM